jgi:outer membrane protein TolC
MRIVIAATLLVLAVPVAAQDTLRLGTLQDAAVSRDARAQQLALRLQAHQLRMDNLRTERLPQLSVLGEATHQSHVPTLPIALPGGDVPEAPRTRYQLSAAAEQLLYDGGLRRRRELAAVARQAELEAELDAALYPLRLEVAEAYFAALLVQLQAAEVALWIEDLETRLAQVRSAVRAGAALPADTAAIEAERLRALQQASAIEAERDAARAILAALTGSAVGDDDALELPDLAAEVIRVQSSGGAAAVRERPELEKLALLRERLERDADVISARTRPQLHAFGQAGIGRPGPFQFFDDALNEYWQLGVRVQWRPWTWGANARERELLRLEQRIAATEESALVARLAREVERATHTAQQLARALELDERIIALREQVERQARRQFEERTLTASEYLTIRNDVFEARVARQRHRVELEHARARFLTTLGVRMTP